MVGFKEESGRQLLMSLEVMECLRRALSVESIVLERYWNVYGSSISLKSYRVWKSIIAFEKHSFSG